MSSLWSQTTHLGASQSLPKRYHPHTICGPHTLGCESPRRMSDCWLTAPERFLLKQQLPWSLGKEQNNFWRKWTPSLCQLWGCYSWKWALFPTSNSTTFLPAPEAQTYHFSMDSFLSLSSSAIQGLWDPKLVRRDSSWTLTTCLALYKIIFIYYFILFSKQVTIIEGTCYYDFHFTGDLKRGRLIKNLSKVRELESGRAEAIWLQSVSSQAQSLSEHLALGKGASSTMWVLFDIYGTLALSYRTLDMLQNDTKSMVSHLV